MKILFVVEDDFPKAGACTSLLNNLFFDGGMREKVNIDVLAVKNKYTATKISHYNGITVFDFALLAKFPTQECRRLLKKHPLKSVSGIVKKTVLKLDSKIVKSSIVKSIQRKINSLNTHKYDAIVAVLGYSEIAAAAINCKQHETNSKLIIYQVDPFSSNKVYPSATQLERDVFEKKLYETADAIITTPILLEESKAKYSEDITAKMVAMEFPNVMPVDCKERGRSDKINCIFTGNIYGNFRNPGYTLKLFDNINSKAEFNIIGSVNAQFKESFSNHRVNYLGPKPLEETKEYLKASDILVNIGNSMTNQVPSKLFEYISYGKPIINICKNRNCPTLPYLQKYPYALNLFEEDEIFDEQVKMLNNFILNNYLNRITSKEIAKIYETCTPQYCAKQMMDVFESL